MATSSKTTRSRRRAVAAAAEPARTTTRPAGGARQVIEFRGVSKLYGGDVGLEQATFSIERGEFVFLVGSTGSGKSTVMRLLIKELETTSGVIRVAGHDLTEMSRKGGRGFRGNIGVV